MLNYNLYSMIPSPLSIRHEAVGHASAFRNGGTLGRLQCGSTFSTCICRRKLATSTSLHLRIFTTTTAQHTMTILAPFELPASAAGLPAKNLPLFLAFIASKDPATGKSWCPDVRAALPPLQAAFAAKTSPEVAFIEVGLPPAPSWRRPDNVYRKKWNVTNVPTLVRYEQVGSNEIRETGRLVEDQILDPSLLAALLQRPAE
ncbi:hypothetical protein F503_00258 [Ophiostoma piceae UAMH 11346]|uniref:Thioredoxin domain-containing protein n=1 Tax=Ophiostoma piceae (strain UAMH 11346) TaxID=1262450 RepID=S3C6M0_OPHP1|nr:hypothetical protein F503_00258 [Ophiostoma piceae UAMH 11346]